MADRLNGGGPGSAGAALRVVFAPGTEPGAAGARPTLIDVDAKGRLLVDGRARAAALLDLSPPRARLVETQPDGSVSSHALLVTALPDARRSATGVQRLEIVVDGWRFELDVESEARARLRERATSASSGPVRGGPSELRAIIPGRVISVEVAEGDTVEPGGRLLVLEAMKMQNEIKAPRSGRVARVAVGAGQTVELGDVLLVLE